MPDEELISVNPFYYRINGGIEGARNIFEWRKYALELKAVNEKLTNELQVKECERAKDKKLISDLKNDPLVKQARGSYKRGFDDAVAAMRTFLDCEIWY